MNISNNFIKLSKKFISYTFEVEPFHAYEISAYLYTMESNTKNCLIAIDFDDTTLTEYVRKCNGVSLSKSKEYYYRYFDVPYNGVIFQKYLLIPKDVSKITISFRTGHHNPEIYLAHSISLQEVPINRLNKQINLLDEYNYLRKQYIQNKKYKHLFQLMIEENKFSLSGVNKKRLTKITKRLSEETLNKVLVYILDNSPTNQDTIYKEIFSICKDSHPQPAITYGKEYAYKHIDDISFIKVLLKRLILHNLNSDAMKLARHVIQNNYNTEIQSILNQITLKQDLKFLEHNFTQKNFNQIINKYDHTLDFNIQMYKFFIDKDYEQAKKYLTKALALSNDEKLYKNLYDLHFRYGHIRKALSVLPQTYKLEVLGYKKKTGTALLDLLENGAAISLRAYRSRYRPKDRKVFYLLHNRLPYNSGGYATRTHGLLTNAASYGWDMHGVSRLGYPEDKISDVVSQAVDVIDGISYHRLKHDDIGLGSLPMTEYLQAYAQALYKFAKKERPALIHAASNHMNGLVGNAVAKALGIPSVYEVRGLWEITRISREPQWEGTDYFNLMVRLETQVAKEADVVLTLTEALKAEMVARGVDEKKILILPNGVDVSRFRPLKKDTNLAKELGITDKTVIGFIGSFVQYEGLEYIVDAVEILVNQGYKDIVALMVGDGAVADEVRQRVADKNLDDYFIFTGRIPHEEVEGYYSLVDIAPLPRKGLPVCEMVSPLKPFEAMAMGKAVLASNVAALAEIVQDGYNGVLFEKDNVKDLASKLEMLINDPTLRKQIGKQAREWVERERDWKHLSKKVVEVYKSFL